MEPAPGPEPEPPDDLAERQLPLRTFNEPVWYRGHKRKNPPLHFNRERGRFCAPEGTLYLGADPRGAFLEAFAHHLGADPRRYIVSQGLLDGILYPCRRAPELHSIALFARVQSDLVAECQPNLLQDPVYLISMLDHYACALVP